ncbi:reverse transcriptase [Elysia marginata]|uniref:Reverse transcriptase n=1 Tax=Elysia marginata TaxID=1093978 RepID=A0AAV4ES16_9GAST|nr:reverse transcriptase [Elysia marginata]
MRCINYKAETEAIKESLNMVNNKISKTSKVVILSDARSVLQALENTKDSELDTVRKKLLDLMARVGKLTPQWIPGHSNIESNERANNLAKLGSGLDQEETTLTYQEAKTMIRMAAGEKWKKSHEDFNKKGDFYKLGRKEQTSLFRLRTGHNKLAKHMFKTFRIGGIRRTNADTLQRQLNIFFRNACCIKKSGKKFRNPLQSLAPNYLAHS